MKALHSEIVSFALSCPRRAANGKLISTQMTLNYKAALSSAVSQTNESPLVNTVSILWSHRGSERGIGEE